MITTPRPPDWDQATEATAEQWRSWFLDCTAVEQLELAGQVLEAMRAASLCMAQDHDGAMRVRDYVATELEKTMWRDERDILGPVGLGDAPSNPF